MFSREYTGVGGQTQADSNDSISHLKVRLYLAYCCIKYSLTVWFSNWSSKRWLVDGGWEYRSDFVLLVYIRKMLGYYRDKCNIYNIRSFNKDYYPGFSKHTLFILQVKPHIIKLK